MAMLEVNNLEVYYGVICALKGISFHVNEGEIVSLIGANGAGKTTTMQSVIGLLPKKSGRTYKECDIDTLGKSSRGAKRIVFSNDGLVYYTDDHYSSFTLLYGEP